MAGASAQGGAGASPAPLKGPALALVAFALALGTFMQVLDSTIANVSLPTIAGNLGVSSDNSTWVVTAFAVANGVAVPLTGWLMGKFGVVRTFCVSVFLFTIASFLCGIAWNLSSLIGFRILQGAVSGPMIPGSQALLISIFPPQKRSTALGIWSMTTLVAPISGVVASRDVAPGQYVSQGGDKPVMTITDPSRVWLIAQVAESDAENVCVGDPVEVTTPAVPGRVFHATIDLVGAALDPQTHRLPVRASIPNPDKALKPQMFASFAIKHLNAGEAIRVPAAAVIHEGDNARVWIMRPDGLLVARDVTTGDSANGLVTITSGLKPGEKIVTSGALFVNEAGIGE